MLYTFTGVALGVFPFGDLKFRVFGVVSVAFFGTLSIILSLGMTSPIFWALLLSTSFTIASTQAGVEYMAILLRIGCRTPILPAMLAGKVVVIVRTAGTECKRTFEDALQICRDAWNNALGTPAKPNEHQITQDQTQASSSQCCHDPIFLADASDLLKKLCDIHLKDSIIALDIKRLLNQIHDLNIEVKELKETIRLERMGRPDYEARIRQLEKELDDKKKDLEKSSLSRKLPQALIDGLGFPGEVFGASRPDPLLHKRV